MEVMFWFVRVRAGFGYCVGPSRHFAITADRIE